MSGAAHATIVCGRVVDVYLDAHSALAQAVDQNTVLLSSRSFGMNPSDRRTLFLHELAHIVQLARPGNDPIRALEDEAWEAACAWAAARPHRIRGRARGPLNALAIVQGGAEGHPSAPPWYSSNPAEPIGNGSYIIVKNVLVLKDMTFESAMDAIIQAKEKEIVLVCHGWSEGLRLPLMDGAASGAQRQQIFPLSADRQFDEPGSGGALKTPIRSDKDVADLAKLSEEQVRTLRTKMNQIRGLKLGHVAFRSCDMGQATESLEAFRNFFGAASVSAPKLFDMYGQFTPEIGTDLKGWVIAKRKAGYHISIDLQVAFGTRKTDTPNAYRIVSRTLNQEALTKWVRAHVADRVGVDRLVVYHGMLDLGVASPDAPNVYFVRDESFISRIVYYAAQ